MAYMISSDDMVVFAPDMATAYAIAAALFPGDYFVVIQDQDGQVITVLDDLADS